MAYEVFRISNESPNQNTFPTTSYSSPASIFGTTPQENSSTFYTWSNFESKITLPSTGLADGYLFIGYFEFESTTNGRFQPQARFNKTTSGGNFTSSQTGGYSRNNSTSDRSYVRTMALELNPTALGSYEFQWKRDVNVVTGGLQICGIEVVSLYFNDAAIFESTSNAIYGGTTPNQVVGFTESLAGSNISFSSNTVTLNGGDDKRYLCFGSYFFEGFGSARTQRWGGFRIDGTKDDTTKAYSYYRDSSNDENGSLFTNIIEATTGTEVDMFCYTGDGTSNNQGGADSDGSGTPTLGSHFMAFIELKDGCRVFKTSNGGASNLNISTANELLLDFTLTENIIQTPFYPDGRNDGLGINITQAESQKRLLLGANIGGASRNVSSGTRYTGFTEFLVQSGTTNTPTTAQGNYLRGQQGSTDTFGWSSNMLSYYNYGWNDIPSFVIRIGTTALGSAGPVDVIGGWLGAWGLDLETMDEDNPPFPRRLLIVR
tara:strand:- start:440 stop:1903 length:1464 start_codon:yes stop_codon:yes gene_type:complete